MASSWVRRSVSGLFSNPPEAVVASGNASSAALAEPVGNTFCFACRNFSGYFYFSRWPGRLEVRRMLAAGIGPPVPPLVAPRL